MELIVSAEKDLLQQHRLMFLWNKAENQIYSNGEIRLKLRKCSFTLWVFHVFGQSQQNKDADNFITLSSGGTLCLQQASITLHSTRFTPEPSGGELDWSIGWVCIYGILEHDGPLEILISLHLMSHEVKPCEQAVIYFILELEINFFSFEDLHDEEQ